LYFTSFVTLTLAAGVCSEHLPRGVKSVDRSEIERLLEQLSAEREALQSRLATVTKAADGLQALLEMTPAPVDWPAVAGSGAGHVDETSRREVQGVMLAPQLPSGEPPRGMEAARQVLESDTSRFWTVREVADEQVRRGWAEPRERGAKGNPPARAALERLEHQYRENVRVIESPLKAYKWISQPSPSQNGSGAFRTEEVSR
jgi:hypothetical protein